MKMDDITILNDIRQRLELVTGEQIEWVAEKLQEPGPGERVVGVLGMPSRSLWALCVQLKGEIALEKAKAMQMLDPALTAEYEERAKIFDELHDVGMEIMWAQARAGRRCQWG